MNEDLHVKYRPQSFDEVLGQEDTIVSLTALIEHGKLPHAFLFSGDSGIGKTTLARILAEEVGCKLADIVEVDAASYSGVDAMRNITEQVNYTAMTSASRFIIIDECHSLSKQAWQSLLKTIEEPPAHVYFAFCTTELGKVPKTIKTRCHAYALAPLKNSDIEELVQYVMEEEDIKIPRGGIHIIVEAAQGSARQALVMLSMCSAAKSKEDVLRICESAEGSKEIIELARQLVGGRLGKKDALKIIKDAGDQNWESARIMMFNYITAVVINRGSVSLLNALDAFSKPIYNQPTGKGEFILQVMDALEG